MEHPLLTAVSPLEQLHRHEQMRVLVYGSAGWIGQQFCAQTKHEVIKGVARPDDYAATEAEIDQVRPDAVCSFLGRTHGPGAPSIDYLEQPGRLYENMRDNYIAPVHLAQICEARAIQFVYLGTGCIYTYDGDKRVFTETDAPNFFGSSYSIVKGWTNQEMHRYKHTLNLRIRMPIAAAPSGRNFIDKLIAYPNICSIPNSMTVLDDMWPIIDRMIDVKETGPYNLVNPGVIEHDWVLCEYRDRLNPTHTWRLISYDEQMNYIKSHRSNNELDTHRLEAFCVAQGLSLPTLKDSVIRCLAARGTAHSPQS